MAKMIVAITGASGSIYALEFLKILNQLKIEVHGVISTSGEKVLRLETGLRKDEVPGVNQWFAVDDFSAPIASGSCSYRGMVVLPCTMGTLSGIAHGQSGNLIHRAADVTLKERRPLVLGVRETPLNRVHLQNMLTATDAGAIVCPAMPAFYHKPLTIEELARDFACRIASLVGYEPTNMKRWQGMTQC